MANTLPVKEIARITETSELEVRSNAIEKDRYLFFNDEVLVSDEEFNFLFEISFMKDHVAA